MRIEELELCNIGPHRKTLKRFDPGVTIITGRNGVGKSTTLLAIEAAITGNWGFAGKKSDNISQHAPAKSPSFARLVATHEDRRFDIVRSLYPAKDVLILDGDGKELVGEKNVNAAIEQVFGKPLDLLSRVLFTRQRELAGFLLAKPAERAELFQLLFGTEDADDLHKLVTTELNNTPVLQATDEREVLRSQIAELGYRAEAARAKLAELPALDPAAAKRNVEIIRAVDGRRSAVGHRRVVLRQLRESRIERELASEKLRELTRELEEIELSLEESKTEYDSKQAQLKAWDRFRRNEKLSNQVRQHFEELWAKRRQLAPPEPINDVIYDDARKLDQTEPAILGQIAQLRQFLQTFDSGVAVCPTCGTPTDQLKTSVEETEQLLASVEANYRILKDSRRQAMQYKTAVELFERKAAELEQHIDRVNQTLASVPDAQAPETSEEDLTLFVAAYDSVINARRQYEIKISQQQAAVGFASKNFQANVELLQITNNLRDLPRPDRTEYAQAQAEALEHSSRSVARGAVLGEIAEIERQLVSSQKRLVVVEKQIAQAAANNAWREHLSLIRPHLHRDGLPRLVSQANLGRLEDDVNELLQEFGVPFRIETTPDLSFLVDFADGRRHSVARLSPGQLTVLSMAFWTAVNSTLASGYGFLVFDEPTDSLDSVNKGCLSRAIERLRSIAQSRNLQVLIVTHDQQISRLGDDLWDLGGF